MSPDPPTSTVEFVRHNRMELALHRLSAGNDPGTQPLLLLHGLGECTPDTAPAHLAWPGDVVGLDFSGHGRSTIAVGGGYTSEALVGDVDAVLEHLGGPVTLLGRGLGAYIALLVAGARPDAVAGALITDGPGIVGGGIHPGSPAVLRPPRAEGTPDPYALFELSRDVRPPDYAQVFAGFAFDGNALDTTLWVSAVVRPAWVEAILSEPGVRTGGVDDGLRHFSTRS